MQKFRAAVATSAFLFLFICASTAQAQKAPVKRIESIPPAAATLLGHSGKITPGTMGTADREFTARYGSEWTVRRGGSFPGFLRMWGRGIPVDPSAVDDAAVARETALEFWKANAYLLPAGVKPADLRLRTNTLSHGIRVVNFEQTVSGVPVFGAGVFTAVKHGRIALIEVRSHPVMGVDVASTVTADQAVDIAKKYLAGMGVTAKAGADAPLVLLPLHSGDSLAYKLVRKVELRKTGGRWTAFVDAKKAAVYALRDERIFYSATVELQHHDRNPGGDLIYGPAAYISLSTPGGAYYTDAGGMFTASGAGSSADLTLQGRYAEINNVMGNTLTGTTGALADGGSYQWSTTGGEFSQAQLDAYRFVNIVRDHAKTLVDSMEYLDAPLKVNVNYDDVCNAWFDGELTFLKSGSIQGFACSNTAEIADVVYHEYAHGFHYYRALQGSNVFDEAVSEGFSDFMSASITGDHRLAPYFGADGSYLRDLEPDLQWPDDQNEDPHVTGLIIGGALWDLLNMEILQLGDVEGRRVVQAIYGEMTRIVSDIPSTYESALLADDDNGDLADGTPHQCAIDAAFGLHGLTGGTGGGLSVLHTPLENQPDHLAPIVFQAQVAALHPECATASVGSVRVVYSTDGGARWTTESMTAASGDLFAYSLPAQPAGTQVLYRIETDELQSGRTITLPDNLGDPNYYLYIGELRPILCDNFENQDPNWTHELLEGDAAEGADDWQWGAPHGMGGDPETAASGSKVWGNDLAQASNWNGEYQPDKVNTLRSPTWDLSAYAGVRLRFHRWLGVEDGTYDKARVYVNDAQAWVNSSSAAGDRHAVDKEWILFDLDISTFAAGRTAVEVRFEIQSDPGLQFGGWTIDDFCLYEMVMPPPVDGDVDDETASEDEDETAETPDGDVVEADDDAAGETGGEDTGAVDGDATGTGSGTEGDGDGVTLGADGDAEETVAANTDAAGANSSGGCLTTPAGGMSGAALLLLGLLCVGRRRKTAQH